MRILPLAAAAALFALTLMMAGARVAACETTGTKTMILLISRPELWTAPAQNAPLTQQNWKPGVRVALLETKTEDAPSSETVGHGWHRIEHQGSQGWLPDAYLAPQPQMIDPADLRQGIGREPVDRAHGLPPDYAPTDLVPVGPLYDPEVKARLRCEAAGALKSMIQAAAGEGIKLQVISGYRPWEKQQELYERRVRENGWGQQTVAKPGHSEHQLGTAVDLTDGNEATLLRESFGDTPAGRWLADHAWEFGFAVSYTRHNEPQTGYAPEPWHYRYWGIGLARTKHFEALGIEQ